MLQPNYLMLLLLGIFFIGVDSCMPGYEDERDRLREHLGIEWVSDGLKKSAFSQTKSIRHSHDLDCDFSNSAQCKWKNMEKKHGFDTLDFYLFEKQISYAYYFHVDWTEFPALQVRPGPSKVSQGEKMLFTGDKKRDEQTAMFYSSQIGCQNSTGNLTFTFWVYNDARVEVVLLEDKPDGTYKQIYEKPYVDCGTINLNTECHAEIPPRTTPFRLAIRAYDIQNKDGSFVMVDNILYSATLCKVGVDLGDNFESSSLHTSAQGKNIESANQLDCSEFDMRCRWRAGGQGMKMWERSHSVLPREFLHNTTGGYIAPSGTYALLYIEQDSKAPLDVLKSDPIGCQSQTENNFSFRFWKTRDVELEVCAQEVGGTIIECQKVASEYSPSPVDISFRKAAKNFIIVIRVVKFNADFDSVVIVDDFKYRATLCSDAVSVFDLGEHFVSTPMLSILLNRNVNSAKELACDFSKRAADCVWGSTENNEGEDSEIAANAWHTGHGPLNEEKFYFLTGKTTMPDGEFAVARFETGGSSLLISEVIRCALDDVSVSFNMWSTGTATLQVCLVEESSPSLLDCQPATSGPVVVDLPPISKPFRIALRADATDQGMIIVDNIDVQGDVCPSVLRQFSSKNFRPADQPDPNVCRLLSCSFGKGHTCLYDTQTIPNSAPFETQSGGIVSASLTKTVSVSVLESVPFRLNTVARLHFNYRVTGDAVLFVCNDSAKKELESCFKVEGTEGDDYIELLPSDTKVYLIGRLSESGTRGILEIHGLRLTDVADNDAC